MTTTYLQRRIAQVQLEAALIRAGFADHKEVAVRIDGSDNPDEVKEALNTICSVGSQSANGVSLKSLYGPAGQPTHAVALAELVEVPQPISKALDSLREFFPTDLKNNLVPAETGWTLCIDSSAKSDPAILLRFVTARSVRKNPRVEAYGRTFSEALGVPVRLELGLMPQQQADRWAGTAHNTIACGLSIGLANGPNSRGTITGPFRKRDGAVGDHVRSHFISAGHAFNGTSLTGRAAKEVYQPASNLNPDRNIGTVEQIAYNSEYSGINLIDAALISSRLVGGPQFGKDFRLVLAGIWNRPLTEHERAYIYGAESGLVQVRVDYTADTKTIMLSANGTRLVYWDLLEFSRDGVDEGKPASSPGDSGAPLLVESDGRYWLAGMVVGGGSRSAKSRKPRSYAVPIQRILVHFEIEPW